MRTSAVEAQQLAVNVLLAAGVPQGAADLQARLLVEAELRGHPSHGLLRLPRLLERIKAGLADPVATGSHYWSGDALLQVDGQQGLGPVVAASAIGALVRRAQRTGIACAAIEGSNHLGMLALYAEMIAGQGFVGICLTISEAIVHPWGGTEPLLGTNPIAIGVPAHPEPLVLDMATSAVSMGKIHDYANRSLDLDPYWAIDARGRPTRDPAAAIGGSLTPFGGPKGYGLAIALEVLVASLADSAMGQDVLGTLDSVHPSTKGDVFIVVKQATGDAAGAVAAYLDRVRTSEQQPGDEPIRIPGDGSRRRRRRALQDGIEVPDAIWSTLLSYPTARSATCHSPGRTVND